MRVSDFSFRDVIVLSVIAFALVGITVAVTHYVDGRACPEFCE